MHKACVGGTHNQDASIQSQYVGWNRVCFSHQKQAALRSSVRCDPRKKWMKLQGNGKLAEPCAVCTVLHFDSPGFRWGIRARGNYPRFRESSPRVQLFIQVALDWQSNNNAPLRGTH
jgi:hypothetical protein